VSIRRFPGLGDDIFDCPVSKWMSYRIFLTNKVANYTKQNNFANTTSKLGRAAALA